MKRRGPAAAALAALLLFLLGAAPAGDVRRYPECVYCGMDREKFGSSRMLIEYAGGKTVPTCSIHCTGIDLALNPHRRIKATWVGDCGSRVLVDAEQAFWVVGGDRPGVMSIRGKWAFGRRSDAEAFVREHGGTITTYDEALKATFEDMYEILR